MKESYLTVLINDIKLKPLNPDLPSNKKQSIECLLCGDIFEAIVKGKVNNYKKHNIPGCKKCTHIEKYKDNQKQHIDFLNRNYDILELPAPVGRLVYNSKILVKKKSCSHEFLVSWYNIKGKTDYCPICNNTVKAARCKELNKVKQEESLMNMDGYKRYKKAVQILSEQNYKTHLDYINPKRYDRVRAGSSGHQLDHIVSIKNCYAWNIPEHICAHPQNLRMIEWKENLQKHASSSLNDIPLIFQEYIDFPSNAMIKKIQEEIIVPNKAIYPVNHKHYLSIYFPDQKLGIFFADFKKVEQQNSIIKYYLRSLRNECTSNDISLLIFFEDEWINKEEIVINMIRQKLRKSNKRTIYARNTTVKELETKQCSKFLKRYHLQGSAQYHYMFGLFDDDNELVSVMTFTKPRSQMSGNHANRNSIELSRFCSKETVAGGASKLLSKAKKILRLEGFEKIFTFADLRYSSGDLYDILGFSRTAYNRPNYKYVINGVRKHRWGYRKDMLRERFADKFDSSKTEYQNMLSFGYDRVWDCGYYKYELSL